MNVYILKKYHSILIYIYVLTFSLGYWNYIYIYIYRLFSFLRLYIVLKKTFMGFRDQSVYFSIFTWEVDLVFS